jgi:hypothetical protein
VRKRVVILGCGPAGLAATLAVINSGSEAMILSGSDQPSQQFGCQYLHEPIPGYEHVSRVRVSYSLTGTPEQYRRKVYGESWQGKVSPEDFIGEHDAWDIRETYRLMWQDLIESAAVPIAIVRIEPLRIWDLRNRISHLKPDRVISTIPAPSLCIRWEDHMFRSYQIYANGTTVPRLTEPNSVVCDGTDAHDWYRVSNVFGYQTTEWSRPQTVTAKAARVQKPLSTDCDCFPEIYRVGRYGTWTKSYLVHQVYPEAMKALR